MKILIIVFLLAFSFAGCATTSMVKTVDDRPRISIDGAPATAQLYVDGVLMGDANTYAGRSGALVLEGGTHLIEVIDGQQTVHSQRVYLGDGSFKTISVSGVEK